MLLLTSRINQGWADETYYSEAREKWQKSHHYKSMLPATAENMLGNFDNQEITVGGITSFFYKVADEYWVKTDDENGNIKDYKIDYVFGFEPLQQYLIETEQGRYQALSLSWDSRPSERGGQRWFHIQGDDHIPNNDRLHWTQPLQNWNGMCADCHSTELKRNYDVDNDRFDTTMKTINVSCGSCHTDENYQDFKTQFNWTITEGQNTAEWLGEKRKSREIEVCAACHSRRTPLTNSFKSSGLYLNSFAPTLITSPEYFPDGQVRDEDYVWGSFLQSKMYAKGVICSDCHDPHSLELKASGNDLCAQCHVPTYFDTKPHHNHPEGSTGSQCVNCHMPETTYMQVDARRDHSLRIPRPDLNHKTSSPDACTTCHADQTPRWAATNIKDWFGEEASLKPHYGEVFNDVMKNEPGAEARLKRLIHDDELPEIIRASGFTLLSNYPSEDSAQHIIRGLSSSEPLIRLGALRATGFIPPEQKNKILSPLLRDGIKAIRIETHTALSKSSAETLTASEQTMWRGEGRYNAALFQQSLGNMQGAEEGYLKAQAIEPFFAASYVNLADLYRAEGNDKETGKMIDLGLDLLPDDPALNFSKALHSIRSGNSDVAYSYLEKAVSLAPENARYAYVYAIALNDSGNSQKAILVLKRAHRLSPNDDNLNMLLLNLERTRGNWKQALKYANKLSKLYPDNQMISRIKADLQQKIGNIQ